MCYCPTPTLHLNLALTGDGAFLFSLKKTHSVWFISVLNYGDTENVLINHLLVIPMSYPCHYTTLCPHKPHKHAHTHTHTHTHTHSHTCNTRKQWNSRSSLICVLICPCSLFAHCMWTVFSVYFEACEEVYRPNTVILRKAKADPICPSITQFFLIANTLELVNLAQFSKPFIHFSKQRHVSQNLSHTFQCAQCFLQNSTQKQVRIAGWYEQEHKWLCFGKLIVIILYVSVILKPCRCANVPHGQSMQKNMHNHSVLYFIRNKWPLTSSTFLFPPLCLPLPGLIFQNT